MPHGEGDGVAKAIVRQYPLVVQDDGACSQRPQLSWDGCSIHSRPCLWQHPLQALSLARANQVWSPSIQACACSEGLGAAAICRWQMRPQSGHSRSRTLRCPLENQMPCGQAHTSASCRTCWRPGQILAGHLDQEADLPPYLLLCKPGGNTPAQPGEGRDTLRGRHLTAQSRLRHRRC